MTLWYRLEQIRQQLPHCRESGSKGAMFEQVSVAVLLDNFLSASNEISNEEADKGHSEMKQSAPVFFRFVMDLDDNEIISITIFVRPIHLGADS
jgi:hypothetical protein